MSIVSDASFFICVCFSIMKTIFKTKEKALAERGWVVVDATGVSLGRLASEIAHVLKGKNRADYTPHVDNGDFVVVVNASKVKLTGKKLTDKIYYSHSQYPGGLKAVPAGEVLARHPDRIIKGAVKGMLPKGPLAYAMINKLKVYGGNEHPHGAQQPKEYRLAFQK